MSEAARVHRFARGFYPELSRAKVSAFDEATISIFGRVANLWLTRRGRFSRMVRQVMALEQGFLPLTDDELGNEASLVRQKLLRHGFLPHATIRAFALIREFSARRLGKKHYPVQLMGGFVMLHGMIAEMQTGEGKTLTAALPACTAALAGIRVHVITVNDYLAQRDASLMAPVYEAFGLTVGVISQGMSPEERRRAYACDVTYCTNKDVVFDYLKDRLALGQRRSAIQMYLDRLSGRKSPFDQLLLRGLPFAVIDEADSILVDEARTPLIISGPGGNPVEPEVYGQAIDLASQLVLGADFILEKSKHKAELTPGGKERLAELSGHLGGIWASRRWRQEMGEQALAALFLFHRDKQYILREGKVQIVDEYTGRIMPDRTWERGLHQLIEAKEGCSISPQNEVMARISYQRFFRRYCRVAGMSGTVREVSRELWDVYRLRVVAIPTNRPMIRKPLPYQYVSTMTEKWSRIVSRIREEHEAGRPVLVGTRSVNVSEILSGLLDSENLPHRVLNARQDKEEADIITEAGRKGKITVATNMAGRGTDILLEDEVRRVGGLHVIATELHDSSRIDRQLFGRCGRQGDPGSYEAIVSAEDDLFTSLKSVPLVGSLMRATINGSRISQPFCRLVARFAQWRIQRSHYLIRRHLLQIDEQLESAIAFSGRGE